MFRVALNVEPEFQGRGITWRPTARMGLQGHCDLSLIKCSKLQLRSIPAALIKINVDDRYSGLL
jgi:hypothetical protein